MKVKDVMCSSPTYISPTTTLKEAAVQMRDQDIGFLPIGENDRLIGTITDRDITIRGVAKGNSAPDVQVRDIMTKHVSYCFEEDPIEKAAEIMCKLQLHRLIVLDKNKRLTGILSTGDLAEKAHDEQLCGHVLEKICA